MPAETPLQHDPLWDADDCAAYLKASRSWVYLHAGNGSLPCLKIAGLLRFDPETIRAFARGETAKTGRVIALRPGNG